jgi:hypothetical protein
MAPDPPGFGTSSVSARCHTGRVEPTAGGASRPWVGGLSWWVDHVAASLLLSVLNPLVTFLSWPLVLAGGTALRLVVERRGIATRREVFKASYVMVGIQAAILLLFELGGETADFGVFLFWIVFLAVIPTALYAALMPFAGQRWFQLSRFARRSGGV